MSEPQAFPPLPDAGRVERKERCFSAAQMHAYVLADRSARGPDEREPLSWMSDAEFLIHIANVLDARPKFATRLRAIAERASGSIAPITRPSTLEAERAGMLRAAEICDSLSEAFLYSHHDAIVYRASARAIRTAAAALDTKAES